MPVRFAHRARELNRLPYGLGDMASIQTVRTWYEESFKEIRAFGEVPKTPEAEEAFRDMLSKIYSRHADTLMTMARGLLEWQREHGGRMEKERGRTLSEMADLHDHLDSFFLSRIGIRILIGQ